MAGKYSRLYGGLWSVAVYLHNKNGGLQISPTTAATILNLG